MNLGTVYGKASTRAVAPRMAPCSSMILVWYSGLICPGASRRLGTVIVVISRVKRCCHISSTRRSLTGLAHPENIDHGPLRTSQKSAQRANSQR